MKKSLIAIPVIKLSVLTILFICNTGLTQNKPPSTRSEEIAIDRTLLIEQFFKDFDLIKSYSQGSRVLSKYKTLFEKSNDSELINLLKFVCNRESVDMYCDEQQIVYALVRELTKRDPIKALEFHKHKLVEKFKSHKFRDLFLEVILDTWSSNDHEAAYAWLIKNKVEINSNHYFCAVISVIIAMAKKDGKLAFNRLKKIKAEFPIYRKNSSGIFFGGALKTKADFIYFIEESEDDLEFISGLVEAWARKNHIEVVAWIQTVNDPQRLHRYRRTILRNWFSKDPKAAANWFMESSAPEHQELAARELMTNFSMRRNLKGGYSWIENSDVKNKEALLEALLINSTVWDPSLAIPFLEKVKDIESRLSISRKVYNSLKSKNPEKAQDFLNKSEFKEKLK